MGQIEGEGTVLNAREEDGNDLRTQQQVTEEVGSVR